MNIAYLRISTNEQRQENSYLVQLKAIEKQYTVDKVIKEAVSGGADFSKRTELLTAINKLNQDDNFIVYRMDRLSRDILRTGWIKHEIERKKANLISLDYKSDDLNDRLKMNLLSVFAEYEKEVIRFRINQALALKRQRGEALGGKYPPFGFKFDYNEQGKKILKEIPQEQIIIKKIIKMKNKPITLIKHTINSISERKLSYKLIQQILKRYTKKGDI